MVTAIAVMAIAATSFAQVTPPAGQTAPGDAMMAPAPPVAPGTFMATVMAADPGAATQMGWVSTFVQNLDANIATQFGWRPSQPTTFILFSNSQDMLNALNQTRATPLTNEERMILQNSPSFVVNMVPNLGGVSDVSATGWAILVNLDTNARTNTGVGVADPTPNATGTANWMNWVNAGIARAYANVMVIDVGGPTIPMWFQQGVADAISFTTVPGTSNEMAARAALASARSTNSAPSLTQMQNDFATVNAQSPGAVQAISFISVQSLLNKVGGMQVAAMLTMMKSGQSIDRALEALGGTSLEQLNMDYQVGLFP